MRQSRSSSRMVSLLCFASVAFLLSHHVAEPPLGDGAFTTFKRVSSSCASKLSLTSGFSTTTCRARNQQTYRHDRKRHNYLGLTAHELRAPSSQVHTQVARNRSPRHDDRPWLDDPLHHPSRLITARHTSHRRCAEAQEQGEEGGWRR
jgi:hypothetical protein